MRGGTFVTVPCACAQRHCGRTQYVQAATARITCSVLTERCGECSDLPEAGLEPLPPLPAPPSPPFEVDLDGSRFRFGGFEAEGCAPLLPLLPLPPPLLLLGLEPATCARRMGIQVHGRAGKHSMRCHSWVLAKLKLPNAQDIGGAYRREGLCSGVVGAGHVKATMQV